MSYLLGIDIGTTKSACVVLDAESGEMAYSGSLVHHAEIQGGVQDPEKHRICLHRLLKQISADLKKGIRAIGVTGQMHGVVLWTNDQSRLSSLYTWQYAVPQDLDSIQKICGGLRNGYGMTSLASMAKREDLRQYDHAGTIMDYLVWQMTGNCVMDYAEAASWGAYDLDRHEFHKDVLRKLGIPAGLMPKIVSCGTCAGLLTGAEWEGLPAGIPVMCATGDNQASVYATARHADTEVYLTLGTGAQLSCIIPGRIDGVECRPYPGDRYLAVAAPMCGGAAWAWLEKHVQGWYKELTGTEMKDTQLYDVIDRLAQSAMDDADLPTVSPHFLGERSNPDLRGSIEGLTLTNYTPGKLAAALSIGIIRNLWESMPGHVVAGRSRLMVSGNAIRRTVSLQKACEKVTGLSPIPVEQVEEAACGAALLSREIEA